MKATEIIYSKGLTPALLDGKIMHDLVGTISIETGIVGLRKAMCFTRADNEGHLPLTNNQMLDIAFCCDCLYTDLEVEPLGKDILFKNFHVKSLKA